MQKQNTKSVFREASLKKQSQILLNNHKKATLSYYNNVVPKSNKIDLTQIKSGINVVDSLETPNILIKSFS